MRSLQERRTRPDLVADPLILELRALLERYVHRWSGGRGGERWDEGGSEHRAITDPFAEEEQEVGLHPIVQHIGHTRAEVQKFLLEDTRIA